MMDRAIRALGRIWDAIPVHPIRAKLEVTGSVRNRLSTARRVSVAPAPILARSAKVFAMGSCFAVEIRKALAKAGYDVYPKYRNIKFDPDSQQPGNLPQRDDVTHYDTFTIRQEIERALARTHWSDESIWELRGRPYGARLRSARLYQDPLRRYVYAASLEQLRALRHRTDECIDQGLAAADVIIITLGLTECWQDKRTELYVCLGPESEQDERFDRMRFHASTFADNLDNIKKTVAAIRSVYPAKKIVVTVSPVRLHRTWTGEDIIVANSMSKATLRAAAGELCRSDPGVLYWPSFELSTLSNVWKSDALHIRDNVVRHIVHSFLQASVQPEQPVHINVLSRNAERTAQI